MDERNTTDDQAARAASLSRAAESLAKAAAKLAEAARAMSLVAGVLSQGDLAKLSNLGGSESTPLCLDQTDHTASTDSKEDDGAGLPQPHRLLLDDEADIFLLLCSIIYYHSKVVCYITCNSSLLKLYKGLIDSVTETSALIPASSSKSAIDICYDQFLNKTRSVVLFSETDIPSIPAKEVSEYTVIHVGWPVDKRRYVAQRRVHYASTSILLAYSGDKELYPSGPEIMSQTVDWPGDTGGFRASADILRPLFEERLSELSFETKEEAYLDWIQLHARQGPRFVNSWTPSDLIRRANRFILGPLAYRSPRSLTQQSTLKAPLLDLLPEVPTEFVTQHGLQPAVDEGLLRVEPDVEVDAGHADGSYSANGLSAEDTRPRDGSEVPSPSLLYQSNLGGNNYGELHPVSPRVDANDAQEDPVIEPSLEDETGTRSTSPDAPQRPTGASLLTPNSSNHPHRLLVNTEADVLLFTCAIMSKHQRTICYMPCGPVALKTYKLLIESVTDVLVHVVESSKKDDVYGSFLQVEGTVLLVPESLSPKIEIPGESSWVIHVGWPASEMQYIVQQKSHHAQNNIIIACSADQSLYQSGDIIVNMTEPWPKDGASFRASVSILRPLYEAMLSEIPLEMKEHVYQDWMQFHGIHGPRQVKIWSPITIVERANSYLSDVMQWGREYDGGLLFPEVSAGFVAQNGLELAVQGGLLMVEADSDSDNFFPDPMSRPDSVQAKTDFQHTTGHTYFALDEEFDIIPLMCFLTQKYYKVICFLEGQGLLRPYQKLFQKITGRVVLCPTGLNDDSAVEKAVSQFFSQSSPATLLLASNTKNLDSKLNQGPVDCCIYWGFNVPLKPAKKNREFIDCDTTIVIMMTEQQAKLKSPHDIKSHPSAEIFHDRTEDSVLALERNRTRSALVSTKGIVDSLYGSRLYVLGFGSRKKGAEETAHRLNQYAARALLHGEPEDGSEVYPPVGGRPIASKKLVEKYDLQAAVDAGLLKVK